MKNPVAFLLILSVAAGLLSACEQKEMRDQPKNEAYEQAKNLPGGLTEMKPPDGTVSRGALLTKRAPQPPLTAAELHRGRQIFNHICSPCHSPLGDGRGMVVRRGFPSPPTFHSDRLRNAPDTHFYDVITNGFGIMYPYANRVAPSDRWAVVAYVRALQLSQHAKVADLPPALRKKLREEAK